MSDNNLFKPYGNSINIPFKAVTGANKNIFKQVMKTYLNYKNQALLWS